MMMLMMMLILMIDDNNCTAVRAHHADGDDDDRRRVDVLMRNIALTLVACQVSTTCCNPGATSRDASSKAPASEEKKNCGGRAIVCIHDL